LRNGDLGATPAAPSRQMAMAAFLASCGWAGHLPTALAGDASFRRYYRLSNGHSRAVVMDAPPPFEDVGPFAKVATVLRDLGFSAPEVLAEDHEAGFLLLEDFGDDTYNRLLADGGDETALYALAIDTLTELQRIVATRSALPCLPTYDTARLLDEAALLVDWYLPAVVGSPLAGGLREEYLSLWRQVLPDATAPFPATLVLRDFHIDNLMLLQHRSGVGRCGLLDFQDAVCGPPAYDLVSLVEDARRDVSAELSRAMVARYLDARPALDRSAFRRAARILAAQRNCKILGIFTRLYQRDGKPGYLTHIPRVWRLLDNDLNEPALAPLGQWLDRHLPATLRRTPDTSRAA
jgi:N-acetylmuramate 1-kinase